MKNFKLMLPMLAFICAIGMSFATVESKSEQAFDYILQNGSWERINEVNCQVDDQTCRVQLGEDGPIYEVYDEEGDLDPKPSNTNDPFLMNP